MNAELQEFFHSCALYSLRGKKLTDDVLHFRKIQPEDRGNDLCRMVHKRLVFFFREIVILGNRTSGEFLAVAPGIAKNCRTDFLQIIVVNESVLQQEELSSESATRHAPFHARHDVDTVSNGEASGVVIKKFDAV